MRILPALTAPPVRASAARPASEAAAPAFPDAWVGSWQGELEVSSMPKPVKMSLDIQAVPGTPRYTWTIRYEGQPARAYELLPVDPGRGHWAIDERNGIVLDAFLAGGRLLSQFDVASNRVTSTYERSGDQLQLEMSMFSRAPLASTGHDGSLSTYRLVNVQRARLERQP